MSELATQSAQVTVTPTDDGDEATKGRKFYYIKEVPSVITLPGGYVDEKGAFHREVEIAPTDGYDEDLLTDERLLEDGGAVRKLVANCITRVGDAFHAPKEGRDQKTKALAQRIVDNMLISDKTFLTMLIRWISFRDEYNYRFDLTCDNALCKHMWRTVLDMRTLKVFPLEQPDVRTHQLTLPRSGKVARFRHLYCYDEPKLINLRKKYGDAYMSAALWMQVIDIDGQKPNSARDLQPLSGYDRDELRIALDRIDGGFELTYETECPLCRRVSKRPLEIGGPFFVPSMLASERR